MVGAKYLATDVTIMTQQKLRDLKRGYSACTVDSNVNKAKMLNV